MKRKNGVVLVMAVLGIIGGVSDVARAVPPPPPSGDGGSSKPPPTPPPGKIYFEDNVVIIAPGTPPPSSPTGTRFIVLPENGSGPIPDFSSDPTRRIRTTVERLHTVKTQVESLSGTGPAGLQDPLGLVPVRVQGGEGPTGFFLHEGGTPGEPLRLDRTAPSHTAGVAVDAPPVVLLRRPRGLVPLSYWQLPIP